ncbi:hypothetical protein [Mycobacterium lepromatosis]|uniref:hypothetical protein n=1 Tax=Mycobacterium lepromatosis TaxID=480418 RepID=UPI000AC46A73|nr:hypothetical protein [Mycobacterium lepromatosis]UKN41918.1 hypothetical protein MLPF_0917 [Mycobacterium lepromatosis]
MVNVPTDFPAHFLRCADLSGLPNSRPDDWLRQLSTARHTPNNSLQPWSFAMAADELEPFNFAQLLDRLKPKTASDHQPVRFWVGRSLLHS